MAHTIRLKLLTAATATGAIGSGLTQGAGDGTPYELAFPIVASSWQIEYPGGVPTALAGTILGLIDGNTWGTLASFTQATVGGTITALTYPICIRAVKANLSSYTGPGNVSVYLAGLGY